jgi:hypothetical protein
MKGKIMMKQFRKYLKTAQFLCIMIKHHEHIALARIIPWTTPFITSPKNINDLSQPRVSKK